MADKIIGMSEDTFRATADAVRAYRRTLPPQEMKKRRIFLGGGDESSSSSSSSATDCGCFNCIPSSDATIGGCDACENGAAYQYEVSTGPDKFSDNGGTSTITTFTYGAASACDSSSSSSSSSGGGGSGCDWFSCPVEVCNPADSDSCGTYQMKLTFSLDSDGNLVESVYIVFVSGTDWMAAGT